MSWNDMPSFEEVQEAYRRRALLTARLNIAKARLEIAESELALEKPRDRMYRIAGTKELREELENIRAELTQIEEEINFFLYHKDMFRAIKYGERF